jgi:hypothetical protein
MCPSGAARSTHSVDQSFLVGKSTDLEPTIDKDKVWTRLNVCREGLSDMLCVVWVGRKIYNLPPYEHRCALLRLDTLVKSSSIACTMFIFDVMGGRINSPNF